MCKSLLVMKNMILARLTDEETADRLRANAEHLLRNVKFEDNHKLIGAFAELEIDCRWFRHSEKSEAAALKKAEAMRQSNRFTEVRVVADPGCPLTAEVVTRMVA